MQSTTAPRSPSPKLPKKFKFAHQFSEEQAILAATPLKGCYGEGPDFLHDNVKWLKKQLICLLEGTNEIDLNSHPKEGFSLPILATMFSQLIRNQVNDDVVAMTIGEDNQAMARILIIRMAHSSPKILWLNEAKNGNIPATQEARYFIAAITAVGPYYKANSAATSAKKMTQQKLQWAKTSPPKDTSASPKPPSSPNPSKNPMNDATV